MEHVPELQTGAVFARDFRILDRLAEGGMGMVYLVEQQSTKRRRALKVMHSQLVHDTRHRERFLQEAYVSSQIESDHVVEIVAAGVDDKTGIPWLVMELLRGQTMAERVDGGGPIEHAQALTIVRQLRHVLAQAHSLGLVHRDLKPENIFLAQPRRPDVQFTTKVLDFGISKWVQESRRTAAANSQVIGTPFWMAPEQLEQGARITAGTDVWALGLICFYVLTGRLYWLSGNDANPSISAAIVEMVARPLEAATRRAAQLNVADRLMDGFDQWFSRCVHRDLMARYTDAAQALDSLDDVLASHLAARENARSARREPPSNVGPRPASQESVPTFNEDAMRASTHPGSGGPSLPSPVIPAAPVLPSLPSLPSIPPGPNLAPPVQGVARAAAAGAAPRVAPAPQPVPLVSPSQQPSVEVTFEPSASTMASGTSLTPTAQEILQKLRADPTDQGSLVALFETYRGANKIDRALAIGQVLLSLQGERAHEELRAFVDKWLGVRAAPQGRVDESFWLTGLSSPRYVAGAGRLASLLLPSANRTLTKTPEQLGVRDRERVDPMISAAQVMRATMPVHQSMLLAAATFDVPTMPVLYFRAAQAEPFRALASDPSATLLGGFFQQRPTVASLAFLTGWHVAYHRPELHLRVLFPSAEGLERVLAGARALARGQAPVDLEPDFAKALGQRFAAGSDAQNKLRATLEECPASFNSATWSLSMDCAAARAALLVSGDLASAKAMLAHDPGVPVQDREVLWRDLLDFVVSDTYAMLREALGMAIKRTQ